jgi:hypothetical protein
VRVTLFSTAIANTGYLHFTMVSPPNKLAQTITFWHVQEALSPDATIRTAFVAFLSLSKQMPRYYLKFHLDYFAPNPFNFIIRYHLIIQRYINWSNY